MQITAGDTVRTLRKLGNMNEQLVFINFSEGVSNAYIQIRTSQNDGFTIDGAAINPVPLPASSLLLIGGLAALAGATRRRKAQKS